MEVIIQNPGLQHIVEEIFLHLDFKDILSCSLVNRSCRNILRNPIFWLKKCLKNGLLKKHHGAWARAIQLTMKTKYQKFQRNLKWNLVNILKKRFKDIPCFIDVKSINTLKKHQSRKSFNMESINFKSKKHYIIQLMADENMNDPGVVQLLAPVTKNPNAKGLRGKPRGITPIQRASIYGHENIVKVLTPFSKVPNGPDPSGWTPIQSAAISGYTEVIKILGPLSKKDPNSPDPEGWTPIQTAALKGHTDIVKILAPLSHKNPNSKNKTGFSPMYLAKQMGNNEIVSILKSFK